MAVILDTFEYSLHEWTLGTSDFSMEHNVKRGFELDEIPKGGKKITFDNYLVVPNNVYIVEAEDAQVPEFSERTSLMDLSSSTNMSPVLDTPAIIDSIVDVLPFRFNNTVTDLMSPASEMTPAAVNAILGIEETEKFQDLTRLIADPPLPTISCSPAPIQSPTDSIYSDITQSSSTSLLSAASTSNDSHFFDADFEMFGRDSMKFEDSPGAGGSGIGGRADRYSEMRKRNNLASRRSRQTRRERERDMEKQLSGLFDDNVSLKNKVKQLEELVEKTKRIIIQAVANKR